MAFGEAVEQALGFLPGQQFGGVLLDDFRQVGGQHRSLVHDRIARGQRLASASAGAIHSAETPKAGSRVAVPGSGGGRQLRS